MNQIEHINAALRLLARNTISGLTDTTAEARVASAIYKPAISECLSGYPWSFAKVTTAQLSASPGETPDEHEVYPLPADWLMITRVYEGPDGGEVQYELKGNSLVLDYDVGNEQGLYVDYLAQPNEGLLPPYFSPYLIKTLAAWMALPLTENNTLAETHAAMAARARKTATYSDAISAGQTYLAGEEEYSMIAGR